MLTKSRQSSLERSSKDPVSGQKIWFYYYEIEPHRDYRLIKSVLEPRFWWKDKADLQTFSPEANLTFNISHKPYNYDRLWAQDRDIKHLQMINRFQQGYELSEKDNLYRNLWFLFKSTPAELDTYIPTTFSFRLYEGSFHVELQEFVRFFLAEHKGVKAAEIPAVGDDLDANQKPMKVYHFFNTVLPFGFREKQFQNKKADQIKKDPVLYAGKKANLWMIKPAWMRDGEGRDFQQFGKIRRNSRQILREAFSGREQQQVQPRQALEHPKPQPRTATRCGQICHPEVHRETNVVPRLQVRHQGVCALHPGQRSLHFL